MSCYIHIFVRKKDEFIELTSRGRGGFQSAFGDFAPRGKISEITIEDLDHIISRLNNEREEYYTSIKTYEAEIDTVMNMRAGTVTDRLDEIRAIRENIAEDEEEIKEINYNINILSFLSEILENDKYGNNELQLYAGLECGSKVTVDNILEVGE